MKWIFVGLLLGSAVTSEHDTRETCEGRAVILREKGVTGKCHETGPSLTANGVITLPYGGGCLRVDGRPC